MGDGTKRLTEEDLLAGKCRLIRSFVPTSESDEATDHDAVPPNGAAAESGAAAQSDAATRDRKPKTPAERTEKYRNSLKDERKLVQLNLMTTNDPEKRATLKSLATAILNDAVHAVCAMAARAEDDAKILDVMRVAGDAPGVVELGVLASHDDVRPAVDAVIESPEIRGLVAACLAERKTFDRITVIARNPSALEFFAAIAENNELRACLRAMATDPAFLTLCSGIRQYPQLRRAAHAAQANPKVAAISALLAIRASHVLESVEVAIERPDIVELGKRATVSREIRFAVELAIASPPATKLGHQILSLKGVRAKIALRLMALLIAKRGSRAS